MQNPKQTMPRAMFLAIGLVAVLYISVSIAVFGNLSLETIIKDKDFALAEAIKPIFGEWGFKAMAATALLATASAINATLYAVSQISYTLAKEGDLPEVYEYHVFHSSEGVIISVLLVAPMILFFNLSEIATIAAIAVLLIQGFTHVGHLFKRSETEGNLWLIMGAILGSFGAATFAISYTSRSMPQIIYYIVGSFVLAFIFEVLLRLFTGRVINRQIILELEEVEQKALKRFSL
jgi:amino acid transporter